MSYRICTDSACDIEASLLAEWGISYAPLTLTFEGDSTPYPQDELDPKEFYDKMRAGAIAKTQAVNSAAFVALFEPILKNGEDIFHLAFSSGLSTTCNSAVLAAKQLMEQYPERKITVIDSLQASCGFGLYLYLLVQKKNEGASLDELAAYAEQIRFNVCAWFTVDDLVYLKRGGRISGAAAFVGNALGIMPVLHVDNEGHLINRFKVRGRKTAVASLADQYGKLAKDKENGTVFITHGDCMKDVEELSSLLKSRYGAQVKYINYVGPVIGAHSGPGTLALFFIGDER